MDQLHLQFISFWKGQYLWHCNEQNVWYLCVRGECISSHYHFCLMSCPHWFGQQPPSPLAGCTASGTRQPPLCLQGWDGQLQPWCYCAKNRDILGKSEAKFFSNWVLQCCFSPFDVFYVRERRKDDCCSGIIYSRDANLTVLDQAITLPSPGSCWLWTLSFSNILEFTSRCWNRGHYLFSHILILIVEPKLHFPTHLGWGCQFFCLYSCSIPLLWMSSQWQIVPSCNSFPFSQLLQKCIQNH